MNKRFHHINWISALKPQTAKVFLPFNLIFNAQLKKSMLKYPLPLSYLEPWGTQKNRLNETVLFRIQNICLN